ncbi:hypothetical protein [Acrocarpospora sp. B8E8]|uniref:hypothetical protein n=1 Tax=Acrocarpospora sp. B8E8 TaxID=3153572 RepID=UPI00325DAAFE
MQPTGETTQVTLAPEQGLHPPISGQPLGPGSGIRLFVSSFAGTDPAPAVMDVDTGTLTPVVGLPTPDPKTTLVTTVRGRHALVEVAGPGSTRRGYTCTPSGCFASRQARP